MGNFDHSDITVYRFGDIVPFIGAGDVEAVGKLFVHNQIGALKAAALSAPCIQEAYDSAVNLLRYFGECYSFQTALQREAPSVNLLRWNSVDLHFYRYCHHYRHVFGGGDVNFSNLAALLFIMFANQEPKSDCLNELQFALYCAGEKNLQRVCQTAIAIARGVTETMELTVFNYVERVVAEITDADGKVNLSNLLYSGDRARFALTAQNFPRDD